ncbi:hypothetical protein Tco_0051870 [Tanacetum coccineum]
MLTLGTHSYLGINVHIFHLFTLVMTGCPDCSLVSGIWETLRRTSFLGLPATSSSGIVPKLFLNNLVFYQTEMIGIICFKLCSRSNINHPSIDVSPVHIDAHCTKKLLF